MYICVCLLVYFGLGLGNDTGGFLIGNAFKLIRTTTVVCVKGALVLSPVAIAIVASKSIKPHRTTRRHRTIPRASVTQSTTRGHTEQKSLAPASTSGTSVSSRSAQAHPKPQVGVFGHQVSLDNIAEMNFISMF